MWHIWCLLRGSYYILYKVWTLFNFILDIKIKSNVKCEKYVFELQSIKISKMWLQKGLKHTIRCLLFFSYKTYDFCQIQKKPTTILNKWDPYVSHKVVLYIWNLLKSQTTAANKNLKEMCFKRPILNGRRKRRNHFAFVLSSSGCKQHWKYYYCFSF